jgi:hypothetical protein
VSEISAANTVVAHDIHLDAHAVGALPCLEALHDHPAVIETSRLDVENWIAGIYLEHLGYHSVRTLGLDRAMAGLDSEPKGPLEDAVQRDGRQVGGFEVLERQRVRKIDVRPGERDDFAVNRTQADYLDALGAGLQPEHLANVSDRLDEIDAEDGTRDGVTMTGHVLEEADRALYELFRKLGLGDEGALASHALQRTLVNQLADGLSHDGAGDPVALAHFRLGRHEMAGFERVLGDFAQNEPLELLVIWQARVPLNTDISHNHRTERTIWSLHNDVTTSVHCTEPQQMIKFERGHLMPDSRPIRVIAAGVDAATMARLAQDSGGGRVEAAALGDMQGARMVKKGQADYYLGTCWSGGGGALAAATALLGGNRVGIVGTPGMVVTEERVRTMVGEGRIAFGFAYEQTQAAIPIIIREILAYRDANGIGAAPAPEGHK